MSTTTRRRLTSEEQREVRFWVDALLRGTDSGQAARELLSIGVRTRGAVRTRGSAHAAAPTRFPSDTQVSDILRTLETEASAETQRAVAGALAEFAGENALDVLDAMLRRQTDPTVRAAAVDAIGIIGGERAVQMLDSVISSETDPALREMAESSKQALGRKTE